MPQLALSHQAALVLIPPAALWEPIQAIRRQHDQKVRRWMPHISLIYPFLAPAASVSVLPQLALVAQSLAPLTISLDGFAYFAQRHGVTVWLRPTPSAGISDLRRALQHCLPGAPQPQRPFRPHLSVGQCATVAAARSLIASLEQQWTPLPWLISAFSLIRRNPAPDDVFWIEHSFSLGPPPA